MKSLLATILLVTLLSCRNEGETGIKAEEEKLMQTSRDWSRLAATDSLEKILSYWADDAFVMPPGQPPVKGKAAIRQMLESTSKIPGFRISWEPLSATVSKTGDMGYLLERNQITMTDSTGKPFTQYNKSVTIWRKEADGSWKNVVDMWNEEPSPQK